MSELMRFRVARSPQRLLPCGSEAFIPLYRSVVDPAVVVRVMVPAALPGGAFLSGLLGSGDAVAAANDYITGPTFVSNASHLFGRVGQLDVWLSCKENRPNLKDLIKELKELDSPAAEELVNTQEWLIDRKNVADSLIASMIADVDTSIRAFLHRLMLVFGLVELLVAHPELLKTPDDAYWALRWRTVLLPPEFTNYLRGRRSVLSRRPGRADLYVVRDEWIKYEAGEIAHIENVLPGEIKGREHTRLTETEQTFTQEQEKSQTNELDTQTTDRFDLHDEASTDTNLAVHIEGKVDTSGQYGPTKVDTHIGGDLNYSQEQSQKRATNQATETVAHAVTKVEERVRQARTTRSLTRITETNKHSITNADITKPIVGIYRWVEKVQRLQIFRYPNRFLLEFEIPEPGAWWRWLQDQGKNKGLLTKDPTPFTLNGKDEAADNPLIKASDINNDDYLKLGARYATVGLSPPPEEQVVAIVLKSAEVADPKKDPWIKWATYSTMTVPTGCKAIDWIATIHAWHNSNQGAGSRISISVGAGDKSETIAGTSPVSIGSSILEKIADKVGSISTGVIPVAMMTDSAAGYSININVRCTPTDSAIKQWKINVYDQIAQAYFALKREHDEEIAARSVRQGVEINGSSPERNKEIVRDELKKLVIEMLTGAQFKGRPALKFDYPDDNKGPRVNLSEVPKISSEIQFLEQAFEWENLTYIVYPYYWAGDTRWADLADLNSNDPDFARFLRSGSARVVVPARPGFDEQVNLYTDIGVLWGGGPVPSPEDENYISVAKEIQAQQQAPRDGERGESWEVRLPTTLIWLENSAGLPAKPKTEQKLDEPPGKKL